MTVTLFRHSHESSLKMAGPCCKYMDLPCFILKILSLGFPKLKSSQFARKFFFT